MKYATLYRLYFSLNEQDTYVFNCNYLFLNKHIKLCHFNHFSFFSIRTCFWIVLRRARVCRNNLFTTLGLSTVVTYPKSQCAAFF